eukprot:363497-Chlamydomonas_euryale.AAC.4
MTRCTLGAFTPAGVPPLENCQHRYLLQICSPQLCLILNSGCRFEACPNYHANGAKTPSSFAGLRLVRHRLCAWRGSA